MERGKEYYAFISYQRKDEKWADRLRDKLEHYRLPSNVRKQNASLPKEIRPIFRDTLELAGGVLAKEIEAALQNSKFLIVICSPNSAKSPWVNKEIQTFIDLGREDCIIPFIIDGTPFSDNEETECFPPALRSLKGEKELLGININELSRDAAAIKVVARMFELKFDTLWQRYEREKQKRRIIIYFSICFIILILSLFSLWMFNQYRLTRKSQARAIAEKAFSLIRLGDSFTAKHVALELFTNNSLWGFPYTPEAEALLRESCALSCSVIKGHSRGVEMASFDDNEERIISTSCDETVKVWNAKNGSLLKMLTKYNSLIRYAKFCDKETIVTIGDDKIEFWDASFYEKVDSISAPLTLGASLSPQKDLLATYNTEHIIYIWNLKQKKLIKQLCGHKDFIRSVVFDNTRERVLSISQDSSFFLWDLNTGLPTKLLDKKNYTAIAISPDNNNIVYTAEDNDINIIDFSGKYITSFGKHNDIIRDITYSPDGKRILTASNDKTIKEWDIETQKLVSNYSGHRDGVNTVSYSKNGLKIISSSEDQTIRIWDNGKNDLEQVLMGHKGWIMSALFSSNGKKILTSSFDNTIKIWDVDNGILLKTIKGHEKGVVKAIFNKSESQIASASFDKTVRIWNAEDGRLIKSLNQHDCLVGDITYSPNGSLLASVGCDIIIWNTNDWTIVWKMRPKTPVNKIRISSDGKMLFISFNNKIEVWNIMTKKIIDSWICKDIEDMDVSPDGKLLATAHSNKIIKVWKLFGEHSVRCFDGHDSFVESVRFSADGTHLVSASSDHTVRIWHVQSGILLKTIKAHDDVVRNACFSPQGDKIVSVSDDRTIKIWSWPSVGELLDSIQHQLLNTTLSQEERRMYYLE